MRRARQLVAGALDGKVGGELLDAALVVTTELATNALLHARTAFEVVVRDVDDGFRLEVHDGSDDLPRRKRYSSQAATGRGLGLVDALSVVAGAERTDAGKVVWAVLSELPPPPPVVGAAEAGADPPLGPDALPQVATADAPGGLQVAASADPPDPAGTASVVVRG